jgi:hypothetical protein
VYVANLFIAEFGAENQCPRPSSALVLLMAAQDSVLHLLWLLMGLLHDARRVTSDANAQVVWPNLVMMTGQCKLPS